MVAQTVTDAKRRIVDEIKRRGPATAPELAIALELTGEAVRQHLAALEELDLVVATEPAAPSGRGRPATRWALTDAARSLFPDHHAELTIELLDAVRRAVGEDGLDKVLATRADAQVQTYRHKLPTTDATLRSRVGALARARTDEGYMAEVQRDGDALLLVEKHCPICDAARSCTGICRGEWDVFRRVLGDDVEVERVEHVLSGGTRCTYRIQERRT